MKKETLQVSDVASSVSGLEVRCLQDCDFKSCCQNALCDDSYPLGAPCCINGAAKGSKSALRCVASKVWQPWEQMGGRHEHSWEHLQFARLLCQGYI